MVLLYLFATFINVNNSAVTAKGLKMNLDINVGR